ncbi:MAG: hypothetical protein JWL90_4447 [Chthoniobacteraceae bacterium]|nr:hypothetical protein [Chthoniobacteraceae bacterium]
MDWGIGGLSVYKALRDKKRTADVLYFSDSGSTPYGKLSKEKLRERFVEIAGYFRQREVTQVLVACHAASSAVEADIEVFEGVAFQSIIPAALRSVQRSHARRLGVIGGDFTIHSKVYERTLAGLGKQLAFCPAQPLSAFVEAGELESEAVEAEIRHLLAKLHPIDSLLIACTHYPALTPMFRKVAPNLELLDPGADMAESVREEGSNYFEFFTTGNRTGSARSAQLAFGIEIPLQKNESAA